jgi:cell division protein ZapD
LAIVLRLLRSSGRPEHQMAKGGAFQKMLGGSASQMVRVSIPLGDPFIPEISANKYALNIRFTSPDGDLRPRHCDRDVAFDMTFCNL